MTKQEFITRFNALVPQPGAQFDTAAAMALLNEVTDDYDKYTDALTTQATLQAEIKNREASIDDLRQANYRLFMAVGQNLSNTLPAQPSNAPQDSAISTTPDLDFSLGNQQGDKEISSLLSALTAPFNSTPPTPTPANPTLTQPGGII